MDPRPSKASILGALSQALDLVEGQPEGHALRTCRIALRVAAEVGFDQGQMEDLYFAGVLKDSGCSTNSVRIQALFGGDELTSKRAVKLVDWSSAFESVRFAFAHTERGRSFKAKFKRLMSNVGPPDKVMNEVTEARCSRGAEIAAQLGLGAPVQEAIRSLDEHWDGRGSPSKLRGEEIPYLARILCLAQTFEVFYSGLGPDRAFEMLEDRSGRWFDPDLVGACRSFQGDSEFWESLYDSDVAGDWTPWLAESAAEGDIDSICEAFAQIVDAKSPYTSDHSRRVRDYAVQLGSLLEVGEETMCHLRRGALLHDLGKLGVSSEILEKPGKLTEQEFKAVMDHPRLGAQVLSGIEGFSDLAEIAASHHERLDGKGYWKGLCGDELSLETRVMSVCDVFDALTADRPYRRAMDPDEALRIMRKDEGSAFDLECLSQLARLSQGPIRRAA